MKRGELLSDKRIEKGFSVSALAQELGVPAEEVERWEAGELPDSEHLLALSGLLEISVEDILRGGDNADGGQIGVADGAQGGGKEAEVNVAPQNSGAESADSHRFDFGGVRKERGASSAPEKAAPQESYYEKLHKKSVIPTTPPAPIIGLAGAIITAIPRASAYSGTSFLPFLPSSSPSCWRCSLRDGWPARAN